MKINRFLLCISIITVFCLVYIHQQTAIFTLAYEGKKKLDMLTELLDQKQILVYNIDVLESLPNIESNLLAKQDDFEIVRECRIVKLAGSSPELFGPNVRNLLLRLVSLRLPWLVRQAEAKTIARPKKQN